MCFGYKRDKYVNVKQKVNSDGTVCEQEEEINLPGHTENPFLNTNVLTGILGFRYKTKNYTIVTYSNIECKTFCYIIQITPLKN